jgi:hypothetical protein
MPTKSVIKPEPIDLLQFVETSDPDEIITQQQKAIEILTNQIISGYSGSGTQTDTSQEDLLAMVQKVNANAASYQKG